VIRKQAPYRRCNNLIIKDAKKAVKQYDIKGSKTKAVQQFDNKRCKKAVQQFDIKRSKTEAVQ
jgi:hypothetical protein